MEHNTAKHFALQLGSLVSLYLSLSFLVVLLFGVINLRFPDPAELYYAGESAAASVRIGIAIVAVFFPTYLILTRTVNHLRRKESGGTYLTLTRWLIYLSLLIGGGVLLGDLVAVIMAFLEGELTTRFVFKALVVLIVVGAAFHYYLLDARGYWLKNERQSIMYGIGAAIVTFVAIAYAFSYIETPAEVRERRLDTKQLGDLQDIQWRIVTYYNTNNTLPESLENIRTGSPLPVAPEDRTPYRYEVVDRGFLLCATFAYPSQGPQWPNVIDEPSTIKSTQNWDHAAGDVCFERQVGSSTATITR